MRVFSFRNLTIAVVLYFVIYLILRTILQEVNERDGINYVNFPHTSQMLWLVYRPVMYLDGYLTGQRFHIGPHLYDHFFRGS